jgi:hypothetical protein
MSRRITPTILNLPDLPNNIGANGLPPDSRQSSRNDSYPHSTGDSGEPIISNVNKPILELFTSDFEQLEIALLNTLRYYEHISQQYQLLEEKYQRHCNEAKVTELELTSTQKTLECSLSQQHELFDQVKLLQGMIAQKDVLLSQANADIQSLLLVKRDLKSNLVDIETTHKQKLATVTQQYQTKCQEYELLAKQCVEMKQLSQQEVFGLQYDLQQLTNMQHEYGTLYQDKRGLENQVAELKQTILQLKKDQKNSNTNSNFGLDFDYGVYNDDVFDDIYDIDEVNPSMGRKQYPNGFNVAKKPPTLPPNNDDSLPPLPAGVKVPSLAATATASTRATKKTKRESSTGKKKSAAKNAAKENDGKNDHNPNVVKDSTPRDKKTTTTVVNQKSSNTIPDNKPRTKDGVISLREQFALKLKQQDSHEAIANTVGSSSMTNVQKPFRGRIRLDSSDDDVFEPKEVAKKAGNPLKKGEQRHNHQMNDDFE